jgi:hypothetical protein
MDVNVIAIERPTKENDHNVVVTATINNEEILIFIPPAAIGSRMALYGVDTPAKALAAILREHGSRIDPDIIDPESKEELVQRMKNGDIASVKVTIASGIGTAVTLTAVAADIEAARKVRALPI